MPFIAGERNVENVKELKKVLILLLHSIDSFRRDTHSIT